MSRRPPHFVGSVLSALFAMLLVLRILSPTAGAQTITFSSGVQTYTSLSGATVTMTGSSELFLTGTATVLTNCVINLNSTDAWLFITKAAPSTVSSSYLSQIKVNGATAVASTNVRVVQYGAGTVVIPQSSTFQPLQVFTGPNFTGSSQYFSQYTAYNTATALGSMNNAISSFKLKRGYLATISQNSDGTGTAVCYVAADGDLNVGNLPSGLRGNVSSVFVYPWRWVTKKGIAGDTGDNGALNVGWWYDWNLDQNSTSSLEYVPIRQLASWPTLSGQNWKSRGSNSLLGFNEPDQSTQSDMSVASAISTWPTLLATGLRVGAPAVSDGARSSWLYPFISSANSNNLRVDFVPVHYYWCYTPSDSAGAATQMYNFLLDIWNNTHKPIWITEFNNGANWTSCGDPTSAQQAATVQAMIQMLDSTPWVERYSIYNWVEDVRAVVLNGGRTAAGVNYSNDNSPIGYIQKVQSPGTRGIVQLPLSSGGDDTSGFSNSGMVAGTPAFAAGPKGQAMVFDGTNTHIVLPGNMGNSSSFTFSAWVNWNGGADWQRIFDFGDDTSNFMFLTPHASSGKMRFGIEVGGSEQTLDATALTPGVWTHVALTMGGGTTSIYINGALAASTTSITYNPSQITPMYSFIGRSQFPSDPHFAGMMQDVHIKDYALSASIISSLVNDNPPVFSTPSVNGGAAAQGQPYTFSVAGLASDPDAGDTLTYSLEVGPSWLQVGADGSLSGTPTTSDQGTEYATIGVTDPSGAEASTVVAITLPILNNNGIWSRDSDGMWSDSTMWTGGIPAIGAGNTADFSTLNISAPRTITLDSSRSIGVLKFGDSSGASGWTLTSASGSQLVLSSGGTTSPSINVVQNTATISAPLGGTNGLTKTGTGQLILNGGNSISGTLYVDTGSTTGNDGSLCVASAGAIDQITSPIYIRNNNSGSSTLQFDGSSGDTNVTQDITINGRNGTVPAIENLTGSNTLSGNLLMNVGGGTYVIQSDSGTLDLAGSMYASATGARVATLQGAGNGLVTGSIVNGSGVVGISLSGSGTWTFTGANGYTGPTTLWSGVLEIDGSIATGGTFSSAPGSILTGTGTIGATSEIGGVHNPAPGGGSQTFTSGLSYDATATLNVMLAADSGTISSVNAQAVAVAGGAALNLIFDGPGSTVDFTDSFWSSPHTWPVITSTKLSGEFALGSVSSDANGKSLASYGDILLQQTPTGVSVEYFPLTGQPPGTPGAISATGSNGNTSLSWSAPGGAITYIVERSTTSGGPYTIIATGIYDTSYVDTSAANGTTYYYVILAANGNGTGASSAEIAVRPHAPMTMLKADNTNNLNLPGSWSVNVTPNAYDTVEWAALSGANSVSLGSNLIVQGLIVASTGGTISIGGTNVFYIGPGGIDMSAATRDLTLGSAFTMLPGNQAWNIAAGRTLTLNAAAFTRIPGAALSIPGTGAVADSTAALANDGSSGSGLIPWATYGAGSVTRFASVSSGTLGAYASGSSAATFAWTSANPASMNYDVLGTQGAIGVARSANTVRYIGGTANQGYGSADTILFPVNALMNSGTGTLTISQNAGLSGLVASSGSGELILCAANSKLIVSAPIYNAGATSTGATTNVTNGSTASSVTLVGPQSITLSGSNAFTGGLTVASGTAILGNNYAAGTGPITLASGVITTSGSFTIANPVFIPVYSNVAMQGGTTGSCTMTGNLSGNGILNLSGYSGVSAIRLGGTGSGFSGIVNVVGPNVRLSGSAAGSSSAQWFVNGGLQLDASGSNSFYLGLLTGTGNIAGHFAQTASQVQTLVVGALGADSTYAGSISDNATGNPNFGDANGATKNSVSLMKIGSGTLTLTGNSTYSGNTIVSSGVLVLNGILGGPSAIVVSSGGTLTGSGTTSANAVVNSGGIIAPGNSGNGMFTVSGVLNLNNGSLLNMVLASTSTSATLLANAGVNATGVTTINISTPGGIVPGTYPLITASGFINAGNFNIGTAPPNYNYALSTIGGTLYVTVSSNGPNSIEAWRQLYFGTTSDAGNAADMANPAGDGMTNLLKYALGVNPMVAAKSPAEVMGTTSDGSTLTLEFHRIADPTLTYQVLVSDDLSTWTVIWSSSGSQNVGGDVIVTDVDTLANHPTRFLKLNVSQ